MIVALSHVHFYAIDTVLLGRRDEILWQKLSLLVKVVAGSLQIGSALHQYWFQVDGENATHDISENINFLRLEFGE